MIYIVEFDNFLLQIIGTYNVNICIEMEEFVILIYVTNMVIISNKSWIQTACTVNSHKLKKAVQEEIL